MEREFENADDFRRLVIAEGADGYLVNSFAETVLALKPMFALRAFGGLLFLAGALVMVWNVWATILGKLRVEAPMTDAAYDPEKDRPIAAVAN